MIRRAILPGMEADGEIQKLKGGFVIIKKPNLVFCSYLHKAIMTTMDDGRKSFIMAGLSFLPIFM